MKLLSFGEDEGAREDEEPVIFKKKGIVRPDCKLYCTFNSKESRIVIYLQW